MSGWNQDTLDALNAVLVAAGGEALDLAGLGWNEQVTALLNAIQVAAGGEAIDLAGLGWNEQVLALLASVGVSVGGMSASSLAAQLATDIAAVNSNVGSVLSGVHVLGNLGEDAGTFDPTAITIQPSEGQFGITLPSPFAKVTIDLAGQDLSAEYVYVTSTVAITALSLIDSVGGGKPSSRLTDIMGLDPAATVTISAASVVDGWVRWHPFGNPGSGTVVINVLTAYLGLSPAVSGYGTCDISNINGTVIEGDLAVLVLSGTSGYAGGGDDGESLNYNFSPPIPPPVWPSYSFVFFVLWDGTNWEIVTGADYALGVFPPVSGDYLIGGTDLSDPTNGGSNWTPSSGATTFAGLTAVTTSGGGSTYTSAGWLTGPYGLAYRLTQLITVLY